MKRDDAIARFGIDAFSELAEFVASSARGNEALAVGSEETVRQSIVDALIGGVFEAMCLERDLDPSLARAAVRSLGASADEPLRCGLETAARESFARRPGSFDDEESLGRLYETLLGLRLEPGFTVAPRDARRRSGSHYTPRALAREVSERTLTPILERADSRSALCELRVCDPAMGTGAFALAAARQIARALRAHGVGDEEARQMAVLGSVRGVDVDPNAVRIAKLVLWLYLANPTLSIERLDGSFVTGDALVGAVAIGDPIDTNPLTELFARLGGDLPRTVSWPAEFPDVFARANPGFDAFVGNPPFIGGKRIRTMLGSAYAAWLRQIHDGANGNVDLSAHFLRRAFDLTRVGGRVGFITTNTIAQGDTRSGGLAQICARGGVIESATTRVEWPGEAAVVASVVIVAKSAPGAERGPVLLDGCEVESITAFLRAGTRHSDPERLASRKGIAFVGCFLRGMGFTFDDGRDHASSIAEMHSILRADPSASQVIRPYLGGEELNHSPIHSHHRYVIDLFDHDESEARVRHPEVVALLERKVRPFREALGASSADEAHRARWWRFANDRPKLRAKLRGLSRVLVIPRVTAYLSAVFLPTDVVCSEQLVVVALEGWDAFAVLQSRAHEAWARRYSSTLGDGLRYAPSDCFETFPFPLPSSALAVVGRRYDEYRADWMRASGEGLTTTWRRFHDAADETPEIIELRRLHEEMDRAVLDAYGFHDLEAGATFVPEPLKKARVAGRGATRLEWSTDRSDEVIRRLLVLSEAEAGARRHGERDADARLDVRTDSVDQATSQRRSSPSRRRSNPNVKS